MSRPRRLLAAMLMAAAVAPFSTSSVHASPVAASSAQCILPPGAYGIVNSRGELVGMLIVYPDCTTGIVPVRDI